MDLYLGTDSVTGIEYLVTSYNDRSLVTLATRPGPGDTWSPPVALQPVPAEPPC